MTGCGDDEGNLVAIDVEQLCADSFRNMHTQGCMDTAYAGVDDLKDCFVDCGPADEACLEENCLSAPGAGFSECSGDVDFLFSGECSRCYTDCGLDFFGEESDPGCLFDPNPATAGSDCLDGLYDCVDRC